MSGIPDPQVAERRARVLALRARGLTFQQIAEQGDGLSSAEHAAKDLERALDAERALNEDVDLLERTMALVRLARMEAACQLVLSEATTARDRPAILGATDRLLRIAERRAALSQPRSTGLSEAGVSRHPAVPRGGRAEAGPGGPLHPGPRPRVSR